MSVPEGAVADARAYLRVDGAAEDGLLGTLAGAAIGLCERFTGLALLAVDRSDVVAVGPGWVRLPATPVFAISSVKALDAGGAAVPLPVGGYAIDIDAAGDGWVKLDGPAGQPRLFVEYHAGLAADWRSLPEPLRQGVVRLVAHLHAHRDVMADSGPPAVVAALWRPWRRMRLA
jgi:uncharacterized phiE125 gp8 family phage protein